MRTGLGGRSNMAAGKGFQTTNWMEQNRELFRALKLEQMVTFIVLALIVCVAALNILIALTMMVMEKTRDIAVLMSFGVTGGSGAADFFDAGVADLGDRDGAGVGAWVWVELGWVATTGLFSWMRRCIRSIICRLRRGLWMR